MTNKCTNVSGIQSDIKNVIILYRMVDLQNWY